jgi:FAD/FMN-containing dehydrogenase
MCKPPVEGEREGKLVNQGVQPVVPAIDDLGALRESVAGAVIAPADAGYDQARRSFNALVDRRPAAIVRCFGPGDVATAFDFARVQGLEVAVRGGGHNPAGHCVLDGGLVIDLSLMRNVDVDADARIARSQGGATWLDFDSATQAFGLVTPGGVVGSTGVAGLTFGGGIGHLTAQLGLTSDNLLAADVVTPDGSVARAGEDEDPELLWGLRGGGGNFGVATRLEFRLHPLERVVGGRVVYAGKGVSEALRRFRDVVAGAPRDLSCGALLALDEALEPMLVITPCYTGPDPDPDELRVLRSAPGLVGDGVARLAFLGQQHLFNPPYGEDRNYWKSQFVNELPDELIDELLQRMTALGRPPGQVLFESLHGAPKEADAHNGAVGFRRAAFNISAMASWQDPAADRQFIQWARDTAASLGPWAVSGGYVNYMQADEPIERVRAAFGEETFERLRMLKRRYDPNNVLRRNQNIPPGPD